MTVDLEELEAMIEREPLGPSRGGKRPAGAVAVAVVRALGADDLSDLRNPPEVGSKPKAPLHIRQSHHQLARLIAQGLPDQEISLVTGYSPAYICNLKKGQDFAELITYYSSQRDAVFVDVAERMKVLGLSTLDELQRRLEENPDDWTKGQLMDLAELLLKNPLGKGQGPGAGPPAAGVSLTVQFIRSGESEGQAETNGQIVDAKPRLVEAEVE